MSYHIKQPNDLITEMRRCIVSGRGEARWWISLFEALFSSVCVLLSLRWNHSLCIANNMVWWWQQRGSRLFKGACFHCTYGCQWKRNWTHSESRVFTKLCNLVVRTIYWVFPCVTALLMHFISQRPSYFIMLSTVVNSMNSCLVILVINFMLLYF